MHHNHRRKLSYQEDGIVAIKKVNKELMDKSCDPVKEAKILHYLSVMNKPPADNITGYIDFIDIYLNNFHWPAFNIADSSITVGGILYFWLIIFKKN